MARRSPNWVSAVVAALWAAPAVAAPRILAMFPAGGQRGTTVTVTLHGDGLKDLSGFFPLGQGLTATMLPGGKDDTRTAKVTVAADAPLGRQELRFFDAAAVSNARAFSIGVYPEVAEVESNDTSDKAQALALPVTVNGRLHEYTQVDSYKVALKAGQRVVFEIEGLRVLGSIGDSWLKGYLEIADASGKVLASSQGTSDDYYRWDPVIDFTAPADGVYIASFRDLNWRGDLRAVYRLSVSSSPHAFGIFPLGGKRGTTVPVRFFGPFCADAPQPIVVLPDAADPMQVSLVAGIAATNARPFQPSDLDEILQSDASHGKDSAQTIPFPTVVNGQFASGATDNYRFTLDTKRTVCLDVYSRRLGTPADPEILLRDAKGNLIAADDDSKGRDAGLTRELDAGTYKVSLRDVDGRGGPEFGYRLFVAPPRPSIRAVVAPDSFTAARGQTLSLPVKLERADGANGDVRVELSSAAGIVAAPVTIAAGKAEGTLEVKIAADAPLGPIRLELVATTGRLRSVAVGSETYNIQGTAYQRDRIGPILLVR